MNEPFEIAQNIFHLSSCTFQNQKIIDESTESPFAATMLHEFLASGFVLNRQTSFYRADHFIGYLTIYAAQTQCTHIFGPFFLVTMNDFTNTHYIEKYHIRYSARQTFIEYLEHLPSYSTREIFGIIQYLANIINNVAISSDSITIIDYNLQPGKNGTQVPLLESNNESYLSKLFSSQIGTSLSNYILVHKIEEAKRLLSNTDMSLSSISYQLSFSSQAHFQRAFKKIAGTTPGEYRKQNSTNRS